MKTIRPLLFAMMLISSLATKAQTATAPAIGDGTAHNPYQIATLDNLYWVSQNSAQWASGKFFIQTANIDASATATWFSNGSGGYYGFPCIGGSQTIGNQVSGIFSGNYNGQGYTITNLYIRRPNDRIGLFGRTSAATISNLKIVNPTVIISSTSAPYGAGILMGYGISGTVVDNVHIIGGSLTSNNVTGGFASAGPIVGWEDGITVSNTTTSASVTTNSGFCGGFLGIKAGGTSSYSNCSATGNVISTGSSRVGGFLGQTDNGGTVTFTNCSASGNVSAVSLGGGFIGYIAGNISNFSNCYATGNVTISSSTGGGFYAYTSGNTTTYTNCYSIGQVTGSSTGGFGNQAGGSNTHTNCFWNTQTSGKSTALPSSTPAGIAGKTTAEMTNQTTYSNAGWDLLGESTNGSNDNWMFYTGINNGYPFHNTPTKVWTGSVSDAWTAAGNWQYDNPPTSGSIVKINPGSTYMPAFNSDVTLDRFDFNGADASLVLGNINLTCTQVLGGSVSGYIKTNGTGTLRINVTNGQYRYFPVGNGSYNPLGIANRTGANDVFSVKVRDEVVSGGTSGSQITSPLVNRTWDISKVNSNANPGIDLFFTWNSSEEQGSITTHRLNHHNGSSWEFAAGTSGSPTGSTTRTLRHTGYTGTFSPFSIVNNLITLPVTWLSFTGQKQGDAVLLKWATASEQNTRDYQIEHSTDARSWNILGTTAAAGNSTTTQQYAYVHQQPVKNNARNYYRIKQRDLDGRETYSSIVTIIYNGSGFDFNVFPNPATDVIKVVLSEEKVIRMVSPSGATILTSKLAAGQHQLSVGNLPRGMYLLQADQEWHRVILR